MPFRSFAYDKEKEELDGAKWEAELEWETTNAACNSYSSFRTYTLGLGFGPFNR